MSVPGWTVWDYVDAEFAVLIAFWRMHKDDAPDMEGVLESARDRVLDVVKRHAKESSHE